MRNEIPEYEAKTDKSDTESDERGKFRIRPPAKKYNHSWIFREEKRDLPLRSKEDGKMNGKSHVHLFRENPLFFPIHLSQKDGSRFMTATGRAFLTFE